MPQIEVTFDIDANGIVHVSAKDKGTGTEQSMTITGGTSLDKEDIERMVADAEAHAEEDKKRREAAEKRNAAEASAYSVDKLLKDNAEKLPEEIKTEVQADVDALKKALEAPTTMTRSTPRSRSCRPPRSRSVSTSMRRAARPVLRAHPPARPRPRTRTSSTPRSWTRTRALKVPTARTSKGA